MRVGVIAESQSPATISLTFQLWIWTVDFEVSCSTRTDHFVNFPMHPSVQPCIVCYKACLSFVDLVPCSFWTSTRTQCGRLLQRQTTAEVCSGPYVSGARCAIDASGYSALCYVLQCGREGKKTRENCGHARHLSNVVSRRRHETPHCDPRQRNLVGHG